MIWGQVRDRSKFGSAAKPRRAGGVKSEPERTEATAETKKIEETKRSEPVEPNKPNQLESVEPNEPDLGEWIDKASDREFTAALAHAGPERVWRCLPAGWAKRFAAQPAQQQRRGHFVLPETNSVN